jgi:NAD(P)-dependent dehydrogenase (short-subunit alcohol dehydrogenase family)
MSPTTRVRAADPDRGTAVATRTPGRYDGKVAVVTGAASGIGRATARRLAAEGAAVACLDIDEAGLATVVDAIKEEGTGSALALTCDVTDEEAVISAIEQVTAEFGVITNLCNIAGIGSFSHTTDESLERWEKVLAVNLTGTFLLARTVLPAMLEHGGAIVNTVSTAGIIGQPYSAAYCASKGGVLMLTKALAVEYMGRGVRVNGIAPGGVDTPIVHDFAPPDDADFTLVQRCMTPLGFAHAHEVGGAFAYLGSDEAAYITGSILSIDGAITA